MPKKVSLISATRKQDQFVKASTLDTDIQENSDTYNSVAVHTALRQQRKKATFNLSAALHQRLKVFAAMNRREMVDVVEEALDKHLSRPET